MTLAEIHTEFQVLQHNRLVDFLPCSVFFTFHNIIENIKGRLLFADLKEFWKENLISRRTASLKMYVFMNWYCKLVEFNQLWSNSIDGLIYVAITKTLADATAVAALHLANKDLAISIHISGWQRSLSIHSSRHDQALHICSTEPTNIIQQNAKHSMNLT